MCIWFYRLEFYLNGVDYFISMSGSLKNVEPMLLNMDNLLMSYLNETK